MLKNYYYTDKEKETLIKSMTFLIDTREKNLHIAEWFDKKGLKWKRKALSQGDYSFMIPQNIELNIPRDMYFDKEIIVERKSSLEELSTNLTKERDRFEKELTLAPQNKVLLIENASYEDIINGNYKSQYDKKSYWASLHSFWHKYHLPAVFMPDPEYSGVFIRGYFEYYLKSLLH